MFIDGGKAELLENALKEIQSDWGRRNPGYQPFLRMPSEYPPTVIDSINAKVANQKTRSASRGEAEANMLRAEADGQADAKLKLAEAGEVYPDSWAPCAKTLKCFNWRPSTGMAPTWQAAPILHSSRLSDMPGAKHSEGYRA
jgi:hypothetical protein